MAVRFRFSSAAVQAVWSRFIGNIRGYFGGPASGYPFVLKVSTSFTSALLFFAMAFDYFKILPATTLVFCVFVTIAVSLFTCAIFVESFCLPEVNRFKSAQVFGLGAIGLVSYLAHGQAGEEVNAIFRQDASAFPYTTTAATAMTIASWAFWPVIIVYLLVLAHLIWRVTKFDEKHAFAMTMVIVNMASFVSFIEHQTRDDGNRKGNLYKIALAMDFNNYFRCANATERTNHVAFIGSDQKRAIVAPKLVMRNNNPAGFSTVEIPAHFPLTTCD